MQRPTQASGSLSKDQVASYPSQLQHITWLLNNCCFLMLSPLLIFQVAPLLNPKLRTSATLVYKLCRIDPLNLTRFNKHIKQLSLLRHNSSHNSSHNHYSSHNNNKDPDKQGIFWLSLKAFSRTVG